MRNATAAKLTLPRGLVLAALLTGACYPFKRDAPYPKRQVTAKEGVNVLIANTARCLVPTKEFSKITVGMMYSCNWHESGATPAPTPLRAPAGR